MAAAEQALLNGLCSSATEGNCQSQTTDLRCDDDRKGRTSAAEEKTINRSVAAPPGAGPHAFWDQSSTCSEMLSAPATSSWRTAATEPSDCLGRPEPRRKPAFEPRCSRALSRCSPSRSTRHRASLCANRSRWRTIGRTSRRTAMPVIDVQVHPFDRNHPGRPWASPAHGLNSATGEEMVAAMKRVGVDGAIMVSSFSAYEYDPRYALEVYNTYPDKFRVVTPVDATNPAIDDVVAKWAATPGARGIRIRMRDGLPMDADHPGLSCAFAAAAKHGLPVNLLCWGILDKGLPHIQRHRDTVIVIDHLGLLKPASTPVPADVWADLPKLLALAQYENVRVKISGACTMSHQPFPYDDIWEPVLRVIDAFGLDRCMWGTDWTRTIGMLSYEQGVAPFRDTNRLSENDKAALMGGTLQKVYKW